MLGSRKSDRTLLFVIRILSFLHTRTQRSLFEIISDRERTHRFQEGNLPGGL